MQDFSPSELYFELALAQAQKALFISPPNPAVGCVLVSVTGSILGQGHTQQAGGPHAEVMAMREAAALGHSVEGATVYVTLEPCSHFGRTPPCCNALIDAKVGKVVVAVLDPNPLVAGKGVQLLRAAGIEVEVLPTDHPNAVAARELNLGFFSRMVRQTPWVRMKIAASLDGKTALPNGQSQWITSAKARDDGHAWRARAGAILTGVGTVLADDPRLDVRVVPTQRQPHVVIVDSELRTPIKSKLFAINNIATQAMNALARSIFIYTNSHDLDRKLALERSGATVVVLPSADDFSKVDLRAMMRDLAKREINDLHVEAGATLNGALISAGLVDEFLIYLAPKLLGSGRGMADFLPVTELKDTLQLKFTSIEKVGLDIRLIGRIDSTFYHPLSRVPHVD